MAQINPIGIKKVLTEQNQGVSPKPQVSFSDVLKESLQKVNELQLNAESAMEKLAAGQIKDVHQVMVAVEEANLAFATMMQIRNKLIDAYNEMMRLQM